MPFSILPLGNTFQITTALERTVQTYDVRRLNLLFASSPPTPGTIARVAAHRDVVYVAFAGGSTAAAGGGSGAGVWVFKRGKKAGELQSPTQATWGAWKDLLVFGEWVIGAFDGALVVWRRESGEVYTEMEITAVTAVCHPARTSTRWLWHAETATWRFGTSRPGG